MRTLLVGGMVYLPDGKIAPRDVLIEGDTILAVGGGLKDESAAIIDLGGALLTPGLVDLHVHLREPGFAYKETIATGTAAAAAGGYTTICAMPNLNPVPDSPEHLAMELELIDKTALIKVLPYGSITVGEMGQELSEIEAMAPNVIGFSDDGKGVQDFGVMRLAMERIRKTGKFISAHCEDESLLRGGSVHEGMFSYIWGLKGISSRSEYGQVERDIALSLESGCPYHVCHISAKESVELVRRAKESGAPVTCEVTPHHIALTDMDISEWSGRFKMNPPLRGEDDRAAILEGIKDGTIEMIATDHAPHSVDEKSKGLEKSAFGTVGSETAFSVCYTNLVRTGVIPLEKLIRLMSVQPGKYIGLHPAVKPGVHADLAAFALDERYTVNPDEFFSKGRSTPFEGMQLYGRPCLTVSSGKVVYRRDESLG